MQMMKMMKMMKMMMKMMMSSGKSYLVKQFI